MEKNVKDIVERSKKKYDKHKSYLEALLVVVEDKLREMVASPVKGVDEKHNIPNIAGINKRLKDKESFINKITRPGKSYTDPIHQITDLIGIRIITDYTDDILLVQKALEQNELFEIIHDKSQDVSERLKPNQFGYLSTHFIVKLTDKFWNYQRADLRVKFLMNLEFEIQIRSLLQHSAATLSHTLTYKRAVGAPQKLLRRMAMFEAILEAADETALDLQLLRQEIQQEYKKNIIDGKLEAVPIDVESIIKYVKHSDTAKRWKLIGREIGWPELPEVEIDFDEIKRRINYIESDDDEEEDDDSDSLLKQREYFEKVISLEKKNKEKERDRGRAEGVYNVLDLISKESLDFTNHPPIKSLKDLDQLICNNETQLKGFLHLLFVKLKNEEEHFQSNEYDFLRAILIKEKEHLISADKLIKIGYEKSLVRIYEGLCDFKKS